MPEETKPPEHVAPGLGPENGLAPGGADPFVPLAKTEAAEKVETEALSYTTPAQAREDVRSAYHYWSGKITDGSHALAVAIIGANWAVFGSVDAVLQNIWAQLSIATVILALGINVLGMRKLSEEHRRRMDWSEKRIAMWTRQFRRIKAKRIRGTKETAAERAWPFTIGIICWGRFFRECRVWLPIAGGILFLIALFVTKANPKPPSSFSLF